MEKTFMQIYAEAVKAPSPRQVLIKKVMDATGCGFDAVTSWALGRARPTLEHRRQIADALGECASTLFPDE